MSEKNGELEVFGIGAVAHRTGLSTQNIRMWEKRYGAVEPERTDSNRRLYSATQVERLSLLRALTERGHSIRNIANLELERLQNILADSGGVPRPSSPQGPSKSRRCLMIGAGVGEMMQARPLPEAELVAHYPELPAKPPRDWPKTDLLVIEAETLFPETVAQVREVVRQSEAARTVLIYRFTTSRTATALARAIEGLILLSAPINPDQLRRECLLQLEAISPRERSIPVLSDAIPERLYQPEQLVRLSRTPSSVDCECPQHLAELLQSLSAFEKYSRECEDRNEEDAMLHAYLHRATANARRSLEEALQHVVETEGIDLT